MGMIKAELIDHMGSDLTVVNAARVSFDKESTWEYPGVFGGSDESEWDRQLPTKDEKLIRYLAAHDHYTPFAHPQITLRETVPIFVARQRFKHMVGFTYNEVSRRYVDDEPKFWVPEAYRLRAENKKQGSSDEFLPELLVGEDEQGIYQWEPLESTKAVQRICLDHYKELLAAGVCPEQARAVLPQSMMSSYYVTGSLAAFARAYKLRIDPHAQKEIQDLAVLWDQVIRPLFPVSWAALVD